MKTVIFFISAIVLHGNVLLPSIQDTVVIHKWYYCGPFSIGMREGVLGVDEGIELDTAYYPDTTRTYPSILVQGGYVRWRSLFTDSSAVQLTYADVLWDTIIDYYGIAGAASGTYAYGEILCDGMKRARIIAKGVASFRLNNTLYPGDIYGDGFLQTPVLLKPGVNRVLLKLSGFTSHRFDFKIIPSLSPVQLIVNDITKPDMLREDCDSVYIGIPVMNTTRRPCRDLVIVVEGDRVITSTAGISSIMPFSCVKIPVRVPIERPGQYEEESLAVTLRLVGEGCRTEARIYLSVKEGNTAHTKTFLSAIDRSCQYYAVLPPTDFHPESTYALIMSCHGAGVKAENQVTSYSQKEWAFVVAPTNRRRYGFDWQDWGRLDFLEVLEDVKKHYKIDETRVYLTGHSMGGHGVWHIGTRHPDLFAAIAPSAGWTNFRLYIPWFLQKARTYAHPDLIKYRDLVLRVDDPLLHLTNLRDVPIYILQGGADDNVPPIQGRMFAKALDRLGFDYVYREMQGKGHWWDIDSTPGVDCVDLADMMEFLKAQRRRAVAGTIQEFAEDTTIKHAYFSPFLLVYGTRGDSLSTVRNFDLACMQSYVWWYRANGYTAILPDTEITEDIIQNYNLILIGNGATNAVLKRIEQRLPVRIEKTAALINGEPLVFEDLCLVEIYPNPLNTHKFVLIYSPTSAEAERLMGIFTPLYAGAGLPDYIAYDRSVLSYGWGGIVAAGFFNEKWEYESATCFTKMTE